jgi:predicted helicase
MFELAKILLPNKNIFYIDGNIDVKIREDIRLKIEETTDCIIFGQSSCVSTGLNFKRLHNIIFFFSGKSFSRVIQSIGRTLRLSNDKQFANLIDISFNFKYSVKHLKERLKIYKDMYNKSKPDNIIKLTV